MKAARVYTVERDYYDLVHRILLTHRRDVSPDEWRNMLAQAYESTRLVTERDPAQAVTAAAAYLVGKFGFEYADEVRG